jgi:hypothetical protein
MPIYKGTNEVASGNLYKGSTEIQNGYKATDSFYVNEVTLTLNYTISGNATLQHSSRTITGAPGSSVSITNDFYPTSGYYLLSSSSCSDDGPTLSCGVIDIIGSGKRTTVSGTMPSATTTVNVSVVAATNAYIDVTVIANTNSPWSYISGALPSGFSYQAGTSGGSFRIYFASNADRDAASVSGSRASFRSKFSGSVINVDERSSAFLQYSTNEIRVYWDATGPSFETSSAGTLAGGNTNCSVSIGLPFRLVGTTSFVDLQGS